MNENVKIACACEEGYDKGALKMTLENEIFSIFGNLTKESTILIRYHGKLMTANDGKERKMFLYYVLDNDWASKVTIGLQKCLKCSNNCYCATIPLGNHNKLSFGFCDDVGNFELNDNHAFEFNISKDPILDFMQRYGFEQNKELPTVLPQNTSFYSNLFNNIKKLIHNIIKI